MLLQRLPHPSHSGGVGLISAVAQGIFRLHGAIRLRHLLHQRIGADETAQQAQIDPQKIGEALPGAPQAAFPAGLLHRAEFEPLHRERNALPAAVQQQHRHARRQPHRQVGKIGHRLALGGQAGVMEQQREQRPAVLRSSFRRAAADGVQQKHPERFQAGHAVKQDDGPLAAVKFDGFGIKIRREAKLLPEGGQIFVELGGKLRQNASLLFPAVCPRPRQIFLGGGL